jgi:transcriptional antiterminator NusG
MSFFVVSVQPRKESQFLQAARKGRDGGVLTDVQFHWPQRQLTIRRKGRRKETLAPIFAGYVFLEADEISREVFSAVKRLPGFYRFLESNDRIRPLLGNDHELVSRFVMLGGIIGKSQARLDKNQRVRILHGPLEGLEGLIVRIDKRKQRAKVRLDLYKESFLVDFGLELLGGESNSQQGER